MQDDVVARTKNMYGMADRNERLKTESIRYCKLPMYNFDMSEIQKLVDSYWQTANKESACENSSESSTESSVSTSSSSETDSSAVSEEEALSEESVSFVSKI